MSPESVRCCRRQRALHTILARSSSAEMLLLIVFFVYVVNGTVGEITLEAEREQANSLGQHEVRNVSMQVDHRDIDELSPLRPTRSTRPKIRNRLLRKMTPTKVLIGSHVAAYAYRKYVNNSTSENSTASMPANASLASADSSTVLLTELPNIDLEPETVLPQLTNSSELTLEPAEQLVVATMLTTNMTTRKEAVSAAASNGTQAQLTAGGDNVGTPRASEQTRVAILAQ